MAYRRKTLQKKGFTLLELIVVIGIIGVLTALAVTGMGRLVEGQRRTKTRTTLANAASMFAEYDAATALKAQPSRAFLPAGTEVKPPTFDIWKDTDPAADTQSLKTPPKSFESEYSDPSAGDDPRTKTQAVRNTAAVMRELSRMPGVKAIISQLPSDGVMQLYENPLAPVAAELIGPVLLDAWGNPILYVPASGLEGVYLEGAADPSHEFVVRSNKVYNKSVPADATALAAALPTTARPFFVSAGPDGVFGFADGDGNGNFNGQPDDKAGGDDNLYSFEN